MNKVKTIDSINKLALDHMYQFFVSYMLFEDCVCF